MSATLHLHDAAWRHRLSTAAATAAVLLLSALCEGCALRSLPPVKYVPVLGAEKTVSTTAVLKRALKDRDPAIRAQAVQLLAILGRSTNKGTRKAAAAALGTAARDVDPGVRVLALEQLGRLRSSLANKYLLRALHDPNPFVRKKVLEVMAQREKLSLPAASPPQKAAQAN